jgi:hypothetical protein
MFFLQTHLNCHKGIHIHLFPVSNIEIIYYDIYFNENPSMY